MGLLVAGTKYRGEFEERLKKLMEEIKQNDNIILVSHCPLTAVCCRVDTATQQQASVPDAAVLLLGMLPSLLGLAVMPHLLVCWGLDPTSCCWLDKSG